MNDDRMVWILDGATGRVVHELETRTDIRALHAVGDDGLVVNTFAKSVPAWSKLSSTPVRHALAHEEQCFDVRALAPNVVVSRDGDKLYFFRL